MKRKILAFFLITIFLLTSYAWAVTGKWKLIIRIKGVVESQFRGATKWERIWRNRMLKDGDRARTLKDSRERIKLADNSLISMGQNTEVEMSQYEVKEKSRIVKVKLFFGKIRNKVTRLSGKKTKYEVETPNAVLAAKGTDFYVEYDNETAGEDKGGVTKLIVFEDSILVTSRKESALIAAGNSALIGPSGVIEINPAGLKALPAGSAKPDGPIDIDMIEFEPDLFQASTADVPFDPHAPPVSNPTVTSGVPNIPQGGGVVAPPPGQTGSITVIVNTK